ncbi:response regulator [Streptomyces xiamenensis]|uniref:Transcriptional regulatory protein n=1 Tax=Streptomyces xiamenensis TaxID=408015 RepID=A0A0F7FT19_9ACTN|nr:MULTISPECIES: response regulator [Streptomyces]AKG42828.1 Response regulator of citrate/malate metabolism [Streptomyces xiamenensis]
MINVLVVDDDFMVARLHSKLVERVPGFTVVGEARTGAEALALVAALRPDLVLLDIYLPDMSGLEVLRDLRADEDSDVDVLVITAAREAETVRGALRGGAVHYIIKPFDPPVLAERLRDYARRAQELAAIAVPGQDDVDRVFGAGASRTPPRLPKGLSEQTAELIRGTLAALDPAQDLSAAECAVRSGLSRVSARRYLEYFVSTRQVGVRLRYGATGRPERRYHWSAPSA